MQKGILIKQEELVTGSEVPGSLGVNLRKDHQKLLPNQISTNERGERTASKDTQMAMEGTGVFR